MGSDTEKLLNAFDRATKEFNFCPNRVWAVAREDLLKLMPDGNSILDRDKREESEKNEERENHELCTFDFCEYSQRDFTAVEQRHECGKKKCFQLQDLFSREMLKEAANDGKSTVWSLNGQFMIEPPRPYMAISHVWSDGTGTGAWRDGEVNECLYSFFQGIAKQFQCDGIWWDTLCIPKEKTARNKAIRKIQSNYENARITLVHDCFLRNWNWDQKTACFAILMSPWFSRGWTALELAKSRKVKVIFKGPYGLLIKDLDEQILAKDDEDDGPHKEASRIIWSLRQGITTLNSLRQGITTLNSLLTVLGPRYTSWPKDRAIISGLLLDVELLNSSQKDIWQQDIYKGILVKIGKVSPGHLFHNSATMPKVSWCPTSLFDMPTTDSEASLDVTEALNLSGTWWRMPATGISAEKYNWRGTHPLIKEKLQHHLQSLGKGKCFLLFECQTESSDKSSTRQVDRALLVKERTPETPSYEYIGAVYFYPALTDKDFSKGVDKIKVTLLGDVERMVEPDGNASRVKKGEQDQTRNDSQVYPSH